MGSYTAQILIGSPHPNMGGITPTHVLYLAENGRPSWSVMPAGPAYIYGNAPGGSEAASADGDNGDKTGPPVWIPSLDHMLEDALLMVGVYILKDKQLTELIYEARGKIAEQTALEYGKPSPQRDDFLELGYLSPADRAPLYERCRAMNHRYKAVVTVFEGSSLRGHVGALMNYSMDVEVCLPGFSRWYSAWRRETLTRGSLT